MDKLIDLINQGGSGEYDARQERGEAVAYGCHCDLEEGMEPDACVLDLGRPEDCVYAQKYGEEGRQKCGEWKPVKFAHPTPDAGRVAELEEECKRLREEVHAHASNEVDFAEQNAAIEAQLAASEQARERMREAAMAIAGGQYGLIGKLAMQEALDKAALAADKEETK